MSEGNPRRAIPGIHQGCLAANKGSMIVDNCTDHDNARYPAPRNRELLGEDVPRCDGVRADGGFGFLLHELVGE